MKWGLVLGAVGTLALVVGLLGGETSITLCGGLMALCGPLLAWGLHHGEKERQKLVALYGEQDAQKILSRTLWTGETAEQVRASLGSPADSMQEVLKTKSKETWKYDHRGGNRFGLRVFFENGVVVGWEKK